MEGTEAAFRVFRPFRVSVIQPLPGFDLAPQRGELPGGGAPLIRSS